MILAVRTSESTFVNESNSSEAGEWFFNTVKDGQSMILRILLQPENTFVNEFNSSDVPEYVGE